MPPTPGGAPGRGPPAQVGAWEAQHNVTLPGADAGAVAPAINRLSEFGCPSSSLAPCLPKRDSETNSWPWRCSQGAHCRPSVDARWHAGAGRRRRLGPRAAVPAPSADLPGVRPEQRYPRPWPAHTGPSARHATRRCSGRHELGLAPRVRDRTGDESRDRRRWSGGVLGWNDTNQPGGAVRVVAAG